jgi:hypothetical protein
MRPITAAPLPTWHDVAALLWSTPKDADLVRPWSNGGPFRLFSRSAFAMAELARIFPGPLWLPAYFCQQSTLPARAAGAMIRFYPIKEDLTPDWQACREMAEAEKPALFFIVHYFGFPNPALAEAREFCDRCGAKLIEDAAHVLRPIAGVGLAGEAVLWSPHKLLGIPNGAILTGPLALQIPLPTGDSPGGLVWLAKRLLQKTFPALLPQKPKEEEFFFEDSVPVAPANTPMMSRMAKRMLFSAARRLEAEAKHRRADEALLHKALEGRIGVHPLYSEWGEAAPWRAVFICERPELAALCFAELHGKGILVESWPDLPPEVRAAPERHAAALRLRNSLLAFPLP